MLQQLLQQFLKFSRENAWVYIIFSLALLVVFITGRGNIIEIIFLFVLNIIGNICFILMLHSNEKEDFSLGASYFALGNIFFVTLTLYAYFQNNEAQYLLWQLSFILGGVKNIFRYCFQKEIVFINIYTLGILALGILLYILQLDTSIYALLQSIGFAGVTSGLVLKNDTNRFFLMFLGTLFIVSGSGIGVAVNYIDGSLLGVTLSYALLTLTTLIFYLKLLPTYISRFKNT